MKRFVLFFLLCATCLCGVMAQNNAMFVYRNDGDINAFLKTDIDSIVCSHIDLDSLTHSEYIVQEVWTVDSVYRIPLAVIDSVSFVTPPTVYKSDVVNLSEELVDYIIGAENLTLRLKANTPQNLIPQTGDKIVLQEGGSALPGGFAGKVESVNETSESIDVVCGQVYIEDVFDSFCSVQTVLGYADNGEASPSKNRAAGASRVTYNPKDCIFNLGPYTISRSIELSQGIIPNGDLALKGGASFSVTLEPTFRIHTFIIVGEGHGLYFNGSITGNLTVSSNLSIYGGIEWTHEFLNPEIPFSIPGTMGFVNYYINPGLFLRADATITSSITATKNYTFGMAFDYSSIGEKALRPSLGGRQASSTIDMEGSIDGSVSFGAYFETGFSLKSRELAKVCVRGEYGVQASGNFVLYNSDIGNAEKETALYERLKASSVEVGPFVNASLNASVLNTGAGHSLQISQTENKWDLVPTFSNTKLTRTPGTATSVDAYSELSGDCLFPVPVGYKLFDENKNEVADYDASVKYTNKKSHFDHRFADIMQNKKYIVYPKVKIFGHDILASPSAELQMENFTCPDGNHPHAIDLGLPSGTKWCCCNVGASSPEGYGGYYAWGETSEKSGYDWDTYAFYDSSTNSYVNIGSDISGTQYDVAHVRMGAPWRMPSREQQMELMNNCTREWTQQNGVSGILVTGPNGGQVFLPAAGYRWYGELLYFAGSYGRYWSGSLNPYDDDEAYLLNFRSGYWGWYSYYRLGGQSVRAVCP